MKLAELFEAKLPMAESPCFVVVKVGFDYDKGDDNRAGYAYAVFDAKNKADAEEFAKKADKIDWNENDDHINHMAQNVYGAYGASNGYTDGAKITLKEPTGAKYFGGYQQSDVTFEN